MELIILNDGLFHLVPVTEQMMADIELVKKILLEAAQKCAFVSKDFNPVVRFRVFGDSSLNFELLCWIDKPGERGKTIDFLF